MLLVGGGGFMVAMAMHNHSVGKPAGKLATQTTVVKSNPAPFNPDAGKQIALKNDKPAAGAPLEDIIAYVKHGIVKIETSDVFNHRQGLGSGFVIDASGLVATNYHVVSDAVKAEVLFHDGTRYGVEGYVAVNPQTDLCILKLNGVPANVKALDLVTAEGPRDASKVYAIGHPHDYAFTTTDGIVGSVVHTAQLPQDTKTWLKESLDGEMDNVWIQHNASIHQGNSGGPLINSAGEVLGVNSWIAQKLGFGYAIHSKHLQELVDRKTLTVVALRDNRRKRDSQGEIANSPIASDRIQKLADAMSAKQWRPEGEEDCASLEALALAVTAVRFIQSGSDLQIPMPAEEQTAVVKAVDQIVDNLRKVQWKGEGQIERINDHAKKPHPPFAGAFLFGVIKQRAEAGNHERGWLISLKGSEKTYFIPSEEREGEFAEGDCVLVLGIAHPSRVRFPESPLKPAQVLLSKVMLKVEK